MLHWTLLVVPVVYKGSIGTLVFGSKRGSSSTIITPVASSFSTSLSILEIIANGEKTCIISLAQFLVTQSTPQESLSTVYE